MNPVHITYKTAKRLKEFCPDLPEPMDNMYMREGVEWDVKGCPTVLRMGPEYPPYLHSVPAYQLHDLLSREFSDTFEKAMKLPIGYVMPAYELLAEAYYSGGLPAVEAELLRMMDGK